MARLVCSKYKLRNLPATSSSKPKVSSAAVKVVSNSLTKYKIDRRHQRIKQLKNVKKYSLKYDNVKSLTLPKRYSALKNKGRIFVSSRRHLFNNKVWSSTGVRKSGKIVMSQRKLSRAGNNTDPRRRKKPEPNSALVRIGEFFYKTSRTKLTRSKVEGSSILQSKLTGGTIIKSRKRNCGHIVYVRGIKFVMDPLGKTLKRIHDTRSVNDNGQPAPMKPNLMKRLDIGGFTYVQKSSDLLMRTNTHNTRAFMSQAKQRSIALLTKKMRKNNQPCMIYHRFGKCNRHEKGTCQMVHDPKHVAICRKFLLGQCNVTGCLLSHNVVPEKMPTCKYFLEGCCVRDSCPYLHVKVSAKAEICLKFLQGYCSDGPRCKKRHVYFCPEFDRKGTCRKGKYCPYPHQTGGKKGKVIPKKAKLTCKKSANTDKELEPSRERYYQNKTCQAENKCELVDVNKQNKKRVNPVERSECDSISPLSQSESDDEPRIKRPKLGKLPSYIALDSEKNHPEEN